MYTIIGGDGKEYGPVLAEQIRVWIAGGRADLNTKAKALGSDEWKTLGDFPEFEEGAASSRPPPIGRSGEAAGNFPQDAGAFRQDTGASQTGGGTTPDGVGAFPEGAPFLAGIPFARPAKLDVISCYERSWRLLLTNFWPLVGVTALVMVADILVSLVPFLKVAAQFGLAGVFMGGLQYYYLRTIRGLPATVPDAFAGFSAAMFPLIMVNLVSALLLWPSVILFKEGHLVAAGLVMLPAIYLSVAYQFAYALVIDRGFNFWLALEVSRRTITAQWWRVFLLSLLVIPFFVMGILCLVVGVFVAVVLVQGALLYAYEDLCGGKGG